MENEINPIFYVLMRNDLQSLNAGKAIAQGTHAAQCFANYMENPENFKDVPVREGISGIKYVSNSNKHILDLYNVWKKQTEQGYGTTIVLQVSEKELNDIIGSAVVSISEYGGGVADLITDPEYPFKVENTEIAKLLVKLDDIKFQEKDYEDRVSLTRPESACGYIFMNKDDEHLSELVSGLDLY